MSASSPLVDEGPVPQPPEPYQQDTRAVAAGLDVDLAIGLTDDQVRERLERNGHNRLAEPPRRPAWKVFIDQFRSVLFAILLGAAALAVLVGDGTDAAIIVAVVVINAVIGFVQEGKATRSLAALKSMLVPVATARRGGELTAVAADDLVPGDVVALEAGSRVAADGRLLSAHDLAVDQSSLTGESEPVRKTTAPLDGDLPLADRSNIVHAGTLVVRGRGEMIVTATGMSTEVGRIAWMLASTPQPRTPLQIQLDGTGRRIAAIGIAAVLVYSVAAALRGETLEDILMRGVALAVAAVPEGLPAVLALVLAIGVHRMARRGAIVRRLASVETLGSATVICTDKTGTLTRNRMTVRGLSPAADMLDGPPAVDDDRARLLRALVLCNDAAVTGGQALGEPMEAALVQFALDSGADVDGLRAAAPRCAEVPFSAERKFMLTFHDDGPAGSGTSGTASLIVKGAPDVLLRLCSHARVGGHVVALDDPLRTRLADHVERMGSDGLRVLAAAEKSHVSVAAHGEQLDRAANDLILLGVVGISDPPRPEAIDAVAECHRAGIAVKMITGDHVATAAAIGAEVGIKGRAVTGEQLDAMTPEELRDSVDGIGVFARVSPAHKVAIVNALTERGHVAAMTGDGQNDAAAIRAAHVGVAMGRTGTDVTKEAADLVLTDDNFATIASAVRQGRGIYDNIVKFVRFQLTTNIAAIATFIIAVALGLPAPMTAVQVLWVNLIADGPPALALGLDRPDRHGMDRPPRSATERILSWPRLWRMAVTGLIMALGTLAVLAVAEPDRGTAYATTLAFTTFVLFQVVNAFNVRSEHSSAFSRSHPLNGWLLVSLVVVVLVQALVVYVPALQSIFGTVPLDPMHWLIALAIASVVLVVGEIDKLITRAAGRSA